MRIFLKYCAIVLLATYSVLVSNTAHGKVNLKTKIVVAVIDTGLNLHNPTFNRFICSSGHIDLTDFGIEDAHGHGTHISGLIDKHVNKQNYCQIIIKFWDPRSKEDAGLNMIRAIRYAIALKVDVINISAGGVGFSLEERDLIKTALDLGIKIVVAAGNNGCVLGKTVDARTCLYFPAMYDARLIVVGNLTNKLKPHSSSNRGKYVNSWELGTNLLSLCMDGKLECRMSGTSQATAVKTGKLINSILKRHK